MIVQLPFWLPRFVLFSASRSSYNSARSGIIGNWDGYGSQVPELAKTTQIYAFVFFHVHARRPAHTQHGPCLFTALIKISFINQKSSLQLSLRHKTKTKTTTTSVKCCWNNSFAAVISFSPQAALSLKSTSSYISFCWYLIGYRFISAHLHTLFSACYDGSITLPATTWEVFQHSRIINLPAS